jgi:hypothetical protein
VVYEYKNGHLYFEYRHHSNRLSSPTLSLTISNHLQPYHSLILFFLIITMQFLAAASLFAAALAAPAPQTSDCPNPAHCGAPDGRNYENINIKDFFLRKDNSGIRAVDFKLSGDEVTDILCAVSATALPSVVVQCGENQDSDYKFVLTKASDPSRDVDLTIYHQTGVA